MSDGLQNHPLFTMQPVGRQADFHASQADSRWCIAGNQSGKTTCGAREAVWFATGLHPHRDVQTPTVGWVITLDRTFVEAVLMPAILQFLPKQLVKNIRRGDCVEIVLHNGSQIVFRTYGQGWEKFQGAKIHWAWFDEECPQAVYDEAMIRLMAFRGPHWVTMTPLQGKTWVYTRVVTKRHEYTPEDLEIFSWSTLDNTSLDPKRVEKTIGRMAPEIRAARMRGDFVDLEGLVWPQFDERIHLVDEFPLQAHWPIVVGMDYGYRHPFAAVFKAVDEKGRIIIWKTYRRSERLMHHHARAILEIFLDLAPHAVDTKVAERVLKAIQENRLPDERPAIRARFVIDASAQNCRNELRPYGIAADNAVRDIPARIERVGTLLVDTAEGRPGIVIMRGRNGDLVDEMRSYSWKRRKATGDDKPAPAEPQDINDDACDALGYGVLAAPGAATPLKQAPPEWSPEWLRQQRGRAKRIARRMGNEMVHPDAVLGQMIGGRMRRAW